MCNRVVCGLAAAFFSGAIGMAAGAGWFRAAVANWRACPEPTPVPPPSSVWRLRHKAVLFQSGSVELVFTHALDGEHAEPTFHFRTEGPYQVGSASGTDPGAFEAIFFEDVKFVTLLTSDAAIINAFGFANCGLR